MDTLIKNTEDLECLLDLAQTSLAERKSSLSDFERGFFSWLNTIKSAAATEWKNCFESITCMHAPRHLQEHFSREGLEYVYRHPTRREMSLSLAERYSPHSLEEDERVYMWSRMGF